MNLATTLGIGVVLGVATGASYNKTLPNADRLRRKWTATNHELNKVAARFAGSWGMALRREFAPWPRPRRRRAALTGCSAAPDST